MKPIRFLGDSLIRLREFDADAKQDAGYRLDKVQQGEPPMTLSPCLQLVKELRRLEFGMNRLRIV
jgi:phage-related protein